MDEPIELTLRQFYILKLWAVENTKMQIAEKLNCGITSHCVDKELRSIYKILDVKTRQGCIQQAWFRGIFKKEYFTDDGKDVLGVYLEG